jgi:hypothetical protein
MAKYLRVRFCAILWYSRISNRAILTSGWLANLFHPVITRWGIDRWALLLSAGCRGFRCSIRGGTVTGQRAVVRGTWRLLIIGPGHATTDTGGRAARMIVGGSGRFGVGIDDDRRIVSATIDRWRVDNSGGITTIRVVTVAGGSVDHGWWICSAACRFTLIGPGWVGVIAVASIVMDTVRSALALCIAGCLCSSSRCVRCALFRKVVVCGHRDAADKEAGGCGSADDSYTK